MTGQRRRSEHGQETLQGILVVAFILMPVLVAIFTFGSMIHTEIAAQAAAASGARAAGTAGGFGGPEYAAVADQLQANGVDAASCTITSSAATVSLGQPVAVTVTCPQRVSIPFLFDTNVDLTSTFVARGEVNQ